MTGARIHRFLSVSTDAGQSAWPPGGLEQHDNVAFRHRQKCWRQPDAGRRAGHDRLAPVSLVPGSQQLWAAPDGCSPIH